jgi:hypothetical protein
VWKSLDCGGDDCIALVESERSRRDVWLDPTAVRFFEAATAGTRQWLENGLNARMITECCGTKWRVRFLRVARNRQAR